MSDYNLDDLFEVLSDDVQEQKFTTLPRGIYVFKITDITTEEVEQADKDSGEEELCKKVSFECTITEVKMVKGASEDEALGKKLYKSFNLRSPFAPGSTAPDPTRTRLGYMKAFINAVNGEILAGSMGELISSVAGKQFRAEVVHKKMKGGDTPFPNLKDDSIKPYQD